MDYRVAHALDRFTAHRPASGGRQAHDETAAVAARVGFHVSPRGASEPARERETEARAAVVGVSNAVAAEARFEDRRLLADRNPGPVVLDRHLEPLAAARDAHGRTTPRVAARVLHQWTEDALDQLRLRRRAHGARPVTG